MADQTPPPPPPNTPPPGDGKPPGDGAPPPPAPKPFHEGFYDKDGKIDKTALDRLPDHLKAHKDLFAKYDTFDGLLNGFSNANSMAVKKALAPLKGDEPPEIIAERNAMLDTVLNVPKEAKGYGIKRPDNLPEMYWNEAAAGKFAEVAHKHHLSPDAVKDILGMQTETVLGEVAKAEQMNAEYWTKEQSKWETEVHKQGTSAEDAMKAALRGAATAGIDPKGSLFRHAEVRLAMERLTKLVGESRLATGDPTDTSGGQDELTQARDIVNNAQNPLYKAWHDPLHPQHESARNRWNELYRIDGEKKQKRGIAAP